MSFVKCKGFWFARSYCWVKRPRLPQPSISGHWVANSQVRRRNWSLRNIEKLRDHWLGSSPSHHKFVKGGFFVASFVASNSLVANKVEIAIRKLAGRNINLWFPPFQRLKYSKFLFLTDSPSFPLHRDVSGIRMLRVTVCILVISVPLCVPVFFWLFAVVSPQRLFSSAESVKGSVSGYVNFAPRFVCAIFIVAFFGRM